MKLRQKTLIIILLTTVSLMIIQLIVAYGMTLSFSNFEESSIHQDVELVINILDQERSTLDSVTRDWAYWDDTYNFVDNLNQEYIDTNLVSSTFDNLRLNIILFVNNESQIVYGKAYDLKNKEELPIPDSVNEHIYSDSFIVGKTKTEGKMNGIISLHEGPLLFSSRPILTSEVKGPSHGTIVMGRFIDSLEIKYLADMTNLTLSIYDTSNKEMPSDFQQAILHLSGGIPIFIQTLNSDYIAGYTLLNDIYGSPVSILGIGVSRDFYKQGVTGIFYFVLSTLFVCLIISLGTIIIIERLVVSPLSKFSEEVSKVGKSGDLSSRITVKGEDELSDAAKTVNIMLDELEQSQNRLHTERILAVGQTATMTAHDLRNPLQVIINSIYLAKEELKTQPSKYKDHLVRQEQKLNDIERQVEYMDKIVSDLHYYGTSLDSELLQTDLHKLIKDIFKTTDVPYNVEVSIVQEQNFPSLLINPSIMKRVFMNLITNAIQAMPNGGRLTVRLYRRIDNVYLNIEDTGVGIPKENLDKIFQPLFTTKPKGQGLGLAVCRRLVESQGGSISVESQEGKGSIFTVIIPIRKEGTM